jgi:hypothetical protein
VARAYRPGLIPLLERLAPEVLTELDSILDAWDVAILAGDHPRAGELLTTYSQELALLGDEFAPSLSGGRLEV